MIPISIDISPIVKGLEVAEDMIPIFEKRVLDRMVSTYEYNLGQQIKELNSTRVPYQNALSIDYVDNKNAVVTLTGKGESRIALMIENGISGFEMMDGFRRSNKAHNKGKPNWYLTIPFREATSEALGESGAFSGKMPPEVQKAAKAQSGKPLSVTDLPEKFRDKKVSHTGYEHKSPIHQGTKHTPGLYKKFRRVSDNSEKGSWVHPGLEARNYMDKAAEELTQSLGDILDSVTEELFGE